MKKFLLSILLVLTLSACSINIKDFNYVASDGYFLMDQSGIIHKDFDTNDKLIITLYFEPTSYTNIKLFDETFEAIETLKKQEDIVLRIVPLMFLNDQFENDLSAELGSILLTLAEYDHDLFYEFLPRLRDKEFVKENSDKSKVAKHYFLEEYDKYKQAMLEPLVNATKIYINQNDQPIIRLTYNQDYLDVNFTRFDKSEKELINAIVEFDKLNENELISLFPNILKEKES